VRSALLVLAACASGPRAGAPGPPWIAQLDASRDLDGAVVGDSDAPTIVIVFASWCGHCRDELGVLDALRQRHRVRILAINYRGHEEYDHRGSSDAVRAFARDVPWLRVVPADDALFALLGRPPLIPTMFVYEHGRLEASFDPRERRPPDRDELDVVLARLDP
jgi:thiol-disulfide isomerase/thioredoxin